MENTEGCELEIEFDDGKCENIMRLPMNEDNFFGEFLTTMKVVIRSNWRK